MHDIIGFLSVKNISASDIHHKLCTVHGPNVMSEGAIQQWV